LFGLPPDFFKKKVRTRKIIRRRSNKPPSTSTIGVNHELFPPESAEAVTLSVFPAVEVDGRGEDITEL